MDVPVQPERRLRQRYVLPRRERVLHRCDGQVLPPGPALLLPGWELVRDRSFAVRVELGVFIRWRQWRVVRLELERGQAVRRERGTRRRLLPRVRRRRGTRSDGHVRGRPVLLPAIRREGRRQRGLLLCAREHLLPHVLRCHRPVVPGRPTAEREPRGQRRVHRGRPRRQRLDGAHRARCAGSHGREAQALTVVAPVAGGSAPKGAPWDPASSRGRAGERGPPRRPYA